MEKLILECVIRSVLIAACTAFALAVLRVTAPRVRHAVWASVVALMLVLPLWTAWGPKAVFRVLAAPTPVTVTQSVVVEQTISDADVHPRPVQTTRWNLENTLLALYLMGFAGLLGRLVFGTVRARLLVRGAARRAGRLTSDACVTPITVGWLRPAVILPRGWTQWSREELNAVLTHEDEHARRRDPLVQWVALLNRALFWFHPLAWWLERKLSALAEEACDDAVLMGGHDAVQYSECLLGLARVVQESGARVGAVGMAMPGTFLPQRIRRIVAGGPVERVSKGRVITMSAICMVVSVLFTVGAVGYAAQDVGRGGVGSSVVAPGGVDSSVVAPGEIGVPLLDSRGSVGFAEAAGIGGGIAGSVATGIDGGIVGGVAAGNGGGIVGGVAPRIDGGAKVVVKKKVAPAPVLMAQASPAVPVANVAQTGQSLFGVVSDPSGAVVPRAQVAITNSAGATTSTVVTDQIGRFLFENIDVGTYSLSVKMPGFKGLTQRGIAVANGDAHNAGNMNLVVGSVADSISVTASRSVSAGAIGPIGIPVGPITTLGPMSSVPSSIETPKESTFRFTTGRQPSPPQLDQASAEARYRAVASSEADQASAGRPVRVGGMVKAANLINAVKPVYPVDLRREGVQGTVKFEAVIAKNGELSDIRAIPTNVDSRLIEAALGAVQKWKFQASQLNGEPVEVLTTIDVNFSLTD